MSDIVVTWPKSRTLMSYLGELRRARSENEVAYFKVAGKPKVERGDRCYHVHDGAVRGWLPVLRVVEMGNSPLIDSVTKEQFAPGIYVVRSPIWNWLNPSEPLAGFRGFRYR